MTHETRDVPEFTPASADGLDPDETSGRVLENRRLVQRAFDSMSAGPDQFLAEHDEIYAEDLVAHFPGMPPVTVELHRQFGLSTYVAFPDLVRPVEDIVATYDKAVVRWTSSGTHLGPYFGAAPTGRRLSTSGITIFRIADGKVAEEWIHSDMLGLLQQVGAIPALET
jgi:predicted ester cyclase